MTASGVGVRSSEVTSGPGFCVAAGPLPPDPNGDGKPGPQMDTADTANAMVMMAATKLAIRSMGVKFTTPPN